MKKKRASFDSPLRWWSATALALALLIASWAEVGVSLAQRDSDTSISKHQPRSFSLTTTRELSAAKLHRHFSSGGHSPLELCGSQDTWQRPAPLTSIRLGGQARGTHAATLQELQVKLLV